MRFFDEYSASLSTSTVAAESNRLNFRFEQIIARHEELLKGKRVLDIASHDGRFSFAAIRAGGAVHVTGIEARHLLVASSVATCHKYGVPDDKVKFITGDVFEEISKLPTRSIDTVMVLGFLYHTVRQYELFQMIANLGAENIIIDSNVLQNKNPVVRLKWEGTLDDSQIWDASRSRVLSSQPSASALVMFLEEFGYEVTPVEPRGGPIPKDYQAGARVTMIGRKKIAG